MTNKIPQFLIEGSVQQTIEERVKMTISCNDCENIPKVEGAGNITKDNFQIMHNGVKVVNGGYHGNWMSEIIEKLKGHHEPQEEFIFNELLKLLPDNATMIELGCFWSYYSIWFNRSIKGAKNICVEPDPNNLNLGRKNAEINNSSNITFELGAAGDKHGDTVSIPLESKPGTSIDVQVKSIDGLMKYHNIDFLDILHADTQGAEYELLLGAKNAMFQKKLRFVVISTHHYSISGVPNIHQDCIDLILSLGGAIICSHTVAESFSGDGLIVASFSDCDKSLVFETSLNHTHKSLFRPPEKDIELLIKKFHMREHGEKESLF